MLKLVMNYFMFKACINFFQEESENVGKANILDVRYFLSILDGEDAEVVMKVIELHF